MLSANRQLNWTLLLALLLSIPFCGMVFAEDEPAQSADKSRFNLLNPTPSNLMREFNTDRPDITEGPFTVDAGHVQFEMDLFNYAKSRRDAEGTVTDTFSFMATNIRVGITNDVELGVVLQPSNAIRTRMINPPRTTWNAGPDVLELRAKFNLFGNDTYKEPGAIALALLPFIAIPTFRNGVGEENVEGGLAVPFAVKLTDKIDLGLMTEFDLKKNSAGSGYHVEYVNTGVMSYEWTDKLSTYGEVATRFGTQDPFGGIVLVGTGVLYKIKKDLQLDVGANFGLTRASDRINPFIGLSARF